MVMVTLVITEVSQDGKIQILESETIAPTSNKSTTIRGWFDPQTQLHQVRVSYLSRYKNEKSVISAFLLMKVVLLDWI